MFKMGNNVWFLRSDFPKIINKLLNIGTFYKNIWIFEIGERCCISRVSHELVRVGWILWEGIDEFGFEFYLILTINLYVPKFDQIKFNYLGKWWWWKYVGVLKSKNVSEKKKGEIVGVA